MGGGGGGGLSDSMGESLKMQSTDVCVCYIDCFNNTQGTDCDHLLNTHHCRTCSVLTEPCP